MEKIDANHQFLSIKVNLISKCFYHIEIFIFAKVGIIRIIVQTLVDNIVQRLKNLNGIEIILRSLEKVV